MIKSMKLKKNNKIVIVNLLVLLFLNHGVLYYFNPEDIYEYSNPIKYIKYILIMALFITLLREINIKHILYVLMIWTIVVTSHVIANNNLGLMSILNYCFPVLIVCLYSPLKLYLNIKICSISTYVFATIMAYIEFFLMNEPFIQYADAGYRVCSNFINPNNFSAIVWILTIYMLYNINKWWVKISVIGNSCILLVLSGSRAGMIIFAIGIFLIFLGEVVSVLKRKGVVKKKYLKICVEMIGLAIIIIICLRNQIVYFINVLLSGSRQIGNIDLSVGRFGQIIEFLKNVKKNPLFPNKISQAYTDNLYLHLWGFVGIIVCIIFILFNLYLFLICYMRRKKMFCILFFLFFIYGFAENYLYLWPIAYIYWYLVCIVMKKKRRIGVNNSQIVV